MSRRDSPGQEIRIMVMGEIGVGKSTFITKAAEDHGLSKTIIDHSISPPRKGVEEFEVKRKSAAVILIEAPGFNETSTPDRSQLDALIKWLKNMSKTKPKAKINGIIYLYDLNNKFQESSFSMDANRLPKPPGVLFVTCKANNLLDVEKRRADLKEKFPMYNASGEDHFDGSADSAWKFIERIVSANTSVSLQTFQEKLEEITVPRKPAKSRSRGLWGFFSSLFS